MLDWPVWASVSVGTLSLLCGLVALARGFVNARRVAGTFGDEFMLAADIATFSIGGHAVRIKETMRFGVLCLVAALCFAYHSLWSETYGYLWLIGILVAVGCSHISTQMIPGSILILGRSETSTLSLQTQLNRDVSPFRGISLLKTDGPVDEPLVKANCFRVGQDEDWVEAVSILCKYLPLVILDRRESSEFVEEEIRIVLEQDYLHKTLFVMPESGETEVVDYARTLGVPDPSHQIARVSDNDECVRLVAGLLLVAKRVPTREQSLKELLSNDSRVQDI